VENNLIFIYSVLEKVLPKNVYYALQIKPNAKLPFIVYQEINKRSTKYHDDHAFLKITTIQISLVTDKKDLKIEKKLEDTLEAHDINYQMISEYHIKDSGIYRIYEIKMEEFKYEQ